jgi:ATP-dependent exoDNAse (exonuclease V) beta subunit
MKKYSNDKRVVFYEDSHSYFLGDKRLTSITQYISKFKAFFDKDKISKNYAKKHNLEQEQVLKNWDKKSKEACEMGTYVHSVFEEYILNKTIIDCSKYDKCKTSLKFIADYFESENLTPVETEMIVYNENYAGQIDCIAKNKKGEYFILDWKTSSEIKMGNRWKSMNGDYNVYDDCNYNHYSIQLRCYQKMCKEYNIKNCYIVHLKNDAYEIIEARDIEVKI